MRYAFALPLVFGNVVQAAVMLQADVPLTPVDVSGGAVTVQIPLFIAQVSPDTIISAGSGIYSVGAKVTRDSGSASITAAAPDTGNFDDSMSNIVSFQSDNAMFVVSNLELAGLTSPTGRLRFGTISVLLSSAGSTTFSLADNDATLGFDSTISISGDDLIALDGSLTGSSFTVQAVVPEPATAGLLTLVAGLALSRRVRKAR